jgi:fumarate hydratase class II
MNMNEVLANRGSELMGGVRGERRMLHPNDDVNKGQSSNDIFPTAIHVAAAQALANNVLPALAQLRASLHAKARRLPTSSRSAAPTCRTPRR